MMDQSYCNTSDNFADNDSGFSEPPSDDFSAIEPPAAEVEGYTEIVLQLSEEFHVPKTAIIPVVSCGDSTHWIIVYSDKFNRERTQTYSGHNIILKNPNVVSSEASNVIEKCHSQNLCITAQVRELLHDIIKHHYETLFSNHSNLNIISISAVKSKGGKIVKDRPCIVLYCTSKGYIPVGETKFPETLSTLNHKVDIDVREGHFQFGYNLVASNIRHDKLRMGCQISVENRQFSGSMGPFVEYQGELAFLTCAHVIFGIDPNGYNETSRRPYVAQPQNNFPLHDNCGQVRRAVFAPNYHPSSVDAAVVVITDSSRKPCHGEFAIANEWQYEMAGFDDIPTFDSGRINQNPNTIDIDTRIVKFGAETHVTSGLVHCQGTVARTVSKALGIPGSQHKVVMGGQLEIFSAQEPTVFFQPGDSGSGVFTKHNVSGRGELECIGMAIGSTSYYSAIVTPIAAILNALNLNPGQLKSFP